MTTTINASNSGSGGLVQTADASGVLALQTAGTTAVTISAAQVATFANAPVLPAASIPQAALAAGVAGNGPAFLVSGAGTACANGVVTLITFTNETFDTNGCYNNTGSTVTLNGVSAPAYSFAPNVAGYYEFTASVFADGSPVDRPSIYLYKNGSGYLSVFAAGTNIAGGQSYQISGLIYLNGSSDYVQCYYVQSSGGTVTTNASLSYFCGSMARAS